MSASFDRLLRVTCSTKRPPALSGGKRDEAAANLTGKLCTRFYPVTAETAIEAGLQTPHTVQQVYMDKDTDIRNGDYLTVDGVDYPVKAAFLWPWVDGESYMHVVVDKYARKV